METRTKREILFDERINQIDDINMDKLLSNDSDSHATSLDEDLLIPDINYTPVKREMLDGADTVFSLEVMPNEFLDNISLRQNEVSEKKKLNLTTHGKQLFITLTSIAVLLCILFIYNLFVLGGLERRVSAMAPMSYYYQVTEIENDYISFPTGSLVDIQYGDNSYTPFAQTNWFNDTCDGLNQLFGGKY